MTHQKRRFVNQLPAVHQTETLKNFFAATVDNLFQPGASEGISGYIGQKPSYYDPSRDFYVAEPNATRAAYQLEPAMVSVNTDGSFSNSLLYDDLINYLRSQGANVSNHSRLFEGEYYSWAPPIDLDKLNNFRQYAWLGSLSEEDDRKSALVLRAPRKTKGYDGTNNTFELPISEYPDQSLDFPVVLVNGKKVTATFTKTHATISTTGVEPGDIVETIRYGDLTKVINGRPTFEWGILMRYTPRIHGPDGQGGYGDLPRAYFEGEVVYHQPYNKDGVPIGPQGAWRCKIAHTTQSTADYPDGFNPEQWDYVPSAEKASTGMRVRLVDGLGPSYDEARRMVVDGVGEAIKLTPDFMNHAGGRTPRYVVIDRRSRDESPWTRRNVWVHKTALDWSGVDFADRLAVRPIIEFLPNIELYNYGTRRLPEARGQVTLPTAKVIDNFDLYPFDEMPADELNISVSRINGQLIGRLDGGVQGSVRVDNGCTQEEFDIGYRLKEDGSPLLDEDGKRIPTGYVLKPDDRLFVHQSVTTEPELNNLVYKVVANTEITLASGGVAEVLELVVEKEPELGDIIRLYKPGVESVFADQEEWWFNGEEWKLAQSGEDNPLFVLYDSEGNKLDDIGAYPGSDFTGSRLFGYKLGTGANDPVLGFPITYNPYGQPIFEVDPITRRTTFDGGVIGGYYYHHFVEPEGVGSFSNNWFSVEAPSSQALNDGVYDIPLNLQANPGNEEVSFISRNEWFDHFSAIMRAQDGFTGHPYSVNNWRDTAKALGNGNKILQHRAPLLKTMLLASNPNFDLPAAIRYAEQEFVRYRNKFVQTIIDFHNDGVLADTDTPDAWVQAILEHLRLNKSADFPFAYSTVAGDQYFVPPTPAALGILPPAQPALVTDPTFTTPVPMIRGHDGSLVPAFGDLRDRILLAFEQRIYNSIDSKFKTEARPMFDASAYIGGKFFESENAYDRREVNLMLSPLFERWAQVNRLDYHVNASYNEEDPFTWNYSTSVDMDGKPLPGHWRGIYRHYYDTDRPHIAPWEMLGFVDKPVWWDSTYGLAPYTAGNQKLWTDLEEGRIRGGDRAGVDPRYARPGLAMRFVPVDDEGDLLDPIAAHIVDNAPNPIDAAAAWRFGDEGPVEHLWRTSPSFGFALALAGYLMKPARFVEQLWDTVNNVKHVESDQWIYLPTGNRPLNSLITVHGELLADGSRAIGVGVQQWISDLMVSKGQDPTTFGSAVRGLGVRLAHKMAGFTTSDNLRILADNFGLIPAEDIRIELYRSAPVREEVYSGVLIEWTGNGWRVIGYDTRNPSFTMIPGLITGPKGVISLATTPEPVLNKWIANTYYAVNTKVVYQNTVYNALKGHTSGASFEQQYWDAISGVPQQAPRVTTFLLGTDERVVVPYGTEFKTYQEVADFLMGYGRWLKTRGWMFDEVETETQPRDWSLAVREFLSWAQVSWQPGNFITLSPCAEGATFVAPHGMVLDVLNPSNGVYGVVDRTGLPIDRRNVVVNRIDGQTTILSKNNDLYGARVHVGEIEHVLFFSNKTIFNDIIYDPLFNLRQPRLRLIGRRSTDWTGRLDAPGYMLIDNEIASNFDKAAEDLLMMFDIEKADNATLRDHARHVIGYDSRSYLQSLVLSETEQFEFYQGMIHQKGAAGAFSKLMRSDFIEQSRDLKFFEEWAIKIDEYGAIDGRQRLAFLLGHSALRRDPQFIQFRNFDQPKDRYDWLELTDTENGVDELWVDRPFDPMRSFPVRNTYLPKEKDHPVSGYVRTDEVDHIVWSMTDVPGLYDGANLERGSRIWIHHAPIKVDISAPPNTFLKLAAGDRGTTPVADKMHSTADGYRVYRSAACDAPLLGDGTLFTPEPGKTYRATFTVRKTAMGDGAIESFLRPGFSFFRNTVDPILTADKNLGRVLGTGYDEAEKGIDTAGWSLNEWHTVSAEFVVPASATFAQARAHMQINGSPVGNTYVKLAGASGEITIMVDGVAVSTEVEFNDTIEQTTKDVVASINATSDLKATHVSGSVFKLEIASNKTVSAVSTDDLTLSITHSKAVYEVLDMTVSVETNRGFEVLQAFEASADGAANPIKKVVPNSYDAAVTTGRVRIYTERAHGMTDLNLGGYAVIAGPVGGSPEIEGVHQILKVGSDWFEIDSAVEELIDFAADLKHGPDVRVLESVRFSNTGQFNIHKKRAGLELGDLIYLDGENGKPWSVLKRAKNSRGRLYWASHRNQPRRIEAGLIESSLIYDLKTKITKSSLMPEPLVLDFMNVIAPTVGIIPGVAEREIDFKLEFDPASYNDAIGGQWGRAQVGRVWWDTSTVRFLETETDQIYYGITDRTRYNSEVDYRTANWGRIAPATSVDVYEWVRKTVSPIEWMALKEGDTTGQYEGTPYQPDSPSWVQTLELDPVRGEVVPFYYFWMKGLTKTPLTDFRETDVATVARIIANPRAQDMAWIAPIFTNGLLLGGVNAFLDDNFDTEDSTIRRSGTVLQIEVDADTQNDGVIHDEWLLLRPKDERSLPPDWLWDKLRDSLVGFDDFQRPLPWPRKPAKGRPFENTGPVWLSGGPYDGDEARPMSFTVTAEDPEEYQVIYDIVEFPSNADSYMLNGSTEQFPYNWEDHLDIDPNTGEVSIDMLPRFFDADQADVVQKSYFLKLSASDGVHANEATIEIRVRHTNRAPIWETIKKGSLEPVALVPGEIGPINENTAFNFVLKATDPERGPVNYVLTGGALPSSVASFASANGVATISGTAPSLNNTDQAYDFEITAKDEEGEGSKIALKLTFTNQNNAPVWSTPAAGNILASAGSFSRQFTATDADGNTVSYSIQSGTLPPGFNFNTTTGLMTGSVPEVDFDTQYPLTIRATDNGNPSLFTDRQFTLILQKTVNNPPVWTTPANLGSWQTNTNWFYQLGAYDPEGHSVSFAIISGSLPPGISMTSGGYLSGVPSSAGSFSFTVGASDDRYTTPQTHTFSVLQAQTNRAPNWTSDAVYREGQEGTGFNVTTTAATDPDGDPITYGLVGAPAWVNIDPSNGTLTGTWPPSSGSDVYNFTMIASDGVLSASRPHTFVSKKVPVVVEPPNDWIYGDWFREKDVWNPPYPDYIYYGNANPGAGNGEHICRTPRYAISGGGTVTMTARVFSYGLNSGGTGFDLEWYDASYNVIGVSNGTFMPETSNTGQGTYSTHAQGVSLTATAPGNAVQFRVRIYSRSDTTMQSIGANMVVSDIFANGITILKS